MFAGDNLQPELPACLPIFLERLKNEITRLTAVKVLGSILDPVTPPPLREGGLFVSCNDEDSGVVLSYNSALLVRSRYKQMC
jgi:hypothetical protein